MFVLKLRAGGTLASGVRQHPRHSQHVARRSGLFGAAVKLGRAASRRVLQTDLAAESGLEVSDDLR